MTDQTIRDTVPRAPTLNPDFVTVALFSAIGFLAMINLMLLFPELLGALIAQYNQF
jgi:hypothetical protein